MLRQGGQGVEQVFYLSRGEHRGGLIQNQDRRLSIQGFEELDALA